MQPHQLPDLTQSLGDDRFACDVVLACAKIAKCQPFVDKDRTALKEAEEFLDEAIKGYYWLNKPYVDDTIYQCAQSFSQATVAFSGVYINTPKAAAPSSLIEHVQNLKSTTSQLNKNKTVPEQELQALRLFFFFISFSEEIKTEEILNPV